MITFTYMYPLFKYTFAILTCQLLISSCTSLQSVSDLKPNNNKSSYEDFLQKRKDLVQQDSSQYFSADLVLNEKERQLNQLLMELQSERLTYYKDTHFFPPARNFYQSKDHIEQDQLYKIIQRMPKGGALHIHTLAAPDVDWIIQKAMDTPEMYVYWDDAKDKYIKGQMHAFKVNQVPEGFIQAKLLFQHQDSVQQEMKSLLTFDESIDKDSVDIWNEFESIFNRISNFARYDPIMPHYIVRGLQILIEDQVQHVELRMPFLNNLYDLEHPVGTLPIEKFTVHFEYALKEVRKMDPDFTLKVIHANLRFRSQDYIWDDMKKAVKNKKRYPDLLSGYDLVAEEDGGHSTLFHAKSFIKMDSLQKVENVNLPLFLHDGESNWVSSENLYDAVLLGAKRIGHGFNLFRFPSLIHRVKQENICLEINPLSNQILGYIRDLRLHPASTYLRRGVNCTISSDDPMIFNYKGLSFDYWSIFMAWELDLAALKKLSMNGLSYASLDPVEKEKALMIWRKRWSQFIDQTFFELN